MSSTSTFLAAPAALPALPPAPQPFSNVKDIGPGMRVWVDGVYAATVRFVGRVKFPLPPALAGSSTQIGVEYDGPHGTHDGTVHDVRYFDSRSSHGAFVPLVSLFPAPFDVLTALTTTSSSNTAAGDATSALGAAPRRHSQSPGPYGTVPTHSSATGVVSSSSVAATSVGHGHSRGSPSPRRNPSPGLANNSTPANNATGASVDVSSSAVPFSTGYLYDSRLTAAPAVTAGGAVLAVPVNPPGHAGLPQSPGAVATATATRAPQLPLLPVALSPLDPRFAQLESSSSSSSTTTTTNASSTGADTAEGAVLTGAALQTAAAAAALAEMTTALRLNDNRGGQGMHRTWVWGSNNNTELTVTSTALAAAAAANSGQSHNQGHSHGSGNAVSGSVPTTPSGSSSGGHSSNAGGRVVRVPMLMRTPRCAPVAQLGAGLAHTVALTTDGAVHAAGSWRSGVLGLPLTTDQSAFKQLPALSSTSNVTAHASGIAEGLRVVGIAVSDLHNVALLDSGDIVTWGGTLHGKLGRSGLASGAGTPDHAASSSSSRLGYGGSDAAIGDVFVAQSRAAAAAQAAAAAAAVEAAIAASVVPSSSNAVTRYNPYHWAVESAHKRLASSNGDKSTTDASAVAAFVAGGGNYQVVTALSRSSVPLPTLQGALLPVPAALRRVVSVACGTWHTVIGTALGEVFTFGGGGRHNNFGQLGHGASGEDVSEPRRVDELIRQKVHICARASYYSV